MKLAVKLGAIFSVLALGACDEGDKVLNLQETQQQMDAALNQAKQFAPINQQQPSLASVADVNGECGIAYDSGEALVVTVKPRYLTEKAYTNIRQVTMVDCSKLERAYSLAVRDLSLRNIEKLDADAFVTVLQERLEDLDDAANYIRDMEGKVVNIDVQPYRGDDTDLTILPAPQPPVV